MPTDKQTKRLFCIFNTLQQQINDINDVRSAIVNEELTADYFSEQDFTDIEAQVSEIERAITGLHNICFK